MSHGELIIRKKHDALLMINIRKMLHLLRTLLRTVTDSEYQTLYAFPVIYEFYPQFSVTE